MASVFKRFLAAGLMVLAASTSFAEGEPPAVSEEVRGLGEEVQGLKQEVLDLNRDLFLLEEELLFPATTQTTIFLAMKTGVFFALDAVELKIDGKSVSRYLYTEREVAALARGGVQKLHVENLRSGKHELIATFTGKGPNGRDYRRAASYEFEKGLEPKFIELKISDSTAKEQPEFAITAWE